METQYPSQYQSIDNACYPDVASFLAAVNLPARHRGNAHARAFYFGEQRPEFYGADCNTAQDVLRLVADGWPKGRAKMQALLDGLDTSNLAPRDTRRRLRRCELGDAVNIGDIYAGRFQTAWTRAVRQSTVAPQRVDVLVDTSITWNINPEVLFWRGAAAIALCDMLESAGYMVRIVIGFGGALGTERPLSSRVMVKDYDKPLDISTVSAVLLPGFYRALQFLWLCQHCPVKCTDAAGKVHFAVGQVKQEPGELLITNQVNNEFTARRWLENQLARMGAIETAA